MPASPLGELAKRLDAAPKTIRAEMRSAVAAGGKVLARSARAAMPAHLRNVGPNGAALGVAEDVKGVVDRPTSLIRATGPAHIVDNDTKAHDIRPRKGRALRTPYGPKAGVRHKGTNGKHTFDKGIAAGLPEAKAIVEAGFSRAGRRI